MLKGECPSLAGKSMSFYTAPPPSLTYKDPINSLERAETSTKLHPESQKICDSKNTYLTATVDHLELIFKVHYLVSKKK